MGSKKTTSQVGKRRNSMRLSKMTNYITGNPLILPFVVYESIAFLWASGLTWETSWLQKVAARVCPQNTRAATCDEKGQTFIPHPIVEVLKWKAGHNFWQWKRKHNNKNLGQYTLRICTEYFETASAKGKASRVQLGHLHQRTSVATSWGYVQTCWNNEQNHNLTTSDNYNKSRTNCNSVRVQSCFETSTDPKATWGALGFLDGKGQCQSGRLWKW